MLSVTVRNKYESARAMQQSDYAGPRDEIAYRVDVGYLQSKALAFTFYFYIIIVEYGDSRIKG